MTPVLTSYIAVIRTNEHQSDDSLQLMLNSILEIYGFQVTTVKRIKGLGDYPEHRLQSKPTAGDLK